MSIAPSPKRRSLSKLRAERPAQIANTPAPKNPVDAELLTAFSPTALRWNNLDWIVVVWMLAMHAGAVAACWHFTWEALAVAGVLYWFTASIGVCLGYHRFLSHRSLKLRAPARFVTLLAGSLSGEGSPLVWAATHRLHHARSDQPGDPHSPLDGPWWSHLMWLFVGRTSAQRDALFKRYTPDLINDPMLQFFERTYFWWQVACGLALYAAGGLPFLLWGLCLRAVVVYHGTWFVNSATHIWGYRNYETRDESRNLWWVALWSWGEGWHNNHHAHPTLARAGHKWWEIDMTFWSIRALQMVGLAYNVDDRKPEGRAAAEGA